MRERATAMEKNFLVAGGSKSGTGSGRIESREEVVSTKRVIGGLNYLLTKDHV